MGFFSGTDKANLKRTGVYLSDGVMWKDKDNVWQGQGTQHRYKCKLIGLKTVDGRGTAGMVADLEILESTYDKNPAGSHASYFCNFTKVPEAGLRDAMLFVAACFGVDPADEAKVREVATEDMMEYAVDPSNPLAEYGIILWVTTKAKLTGKGNPFTIHFWEPAENPPDIKL